MGDGFGDPDGMPFEHLGDSRVNKGRRRPKKPQFF
jgi:hypothetical protein